MGQKMNSVIRSGDRKMMRMTMMSSISSSGGGLRTGDLNIDIHSDPAGMNSVMSRQLQEVFRMFNGVFGDVRSIFGEEQFDNFGSTADITQDAPQEGNIRDYYLKPGYKLGNGQPKKDINLDEKLTSEEIAGLLKRNNTTEAAPGATRRNGPIFQTVITKSVTKPDGTVETRRIVKDHLGNVEETVTTTQRDAIATNDPDGFHPLTEQSIFKDFYSFWKMF